jgi:hypothetical protein
MRYRAKWFFWVHGLAIALREVAEDDVPDRRDDGAALLGKLLQVFLNRGGVTPGHGQPLL